MASSYPIPSSAISRCAVRTPRSGPRRMYARSRSWISRPGAGASTNTSSACMRSCGPMSSSSVAQSASDSKSSRRCCARRRSCARRASPDRRAWSARRWRRPKPPEAARVRSKLPDVGTTIFTVMSRRARELDALNLGQGFPDYDIDPRLTELVAAAMRAGHNQYAPMEGLPTLRECIAAKLRASYGIAVDPETEVTVTLGATEAIYSAVQALVGPGDEAIAFDPAYDSYEPAVRLAGGGCIRLPLTQPGFRYDWERGRAAIRPRTR